MAGATLTKQAYGHLTGEIFNIHYSTAVTRGNPNLLNGATVTGDVAVFTDPLFPLSEIKQVDFFLNQGNNPPGSTREIRERVAPYDYAGTAGNGNAVLFDTTSLADGLNRISMRVVFTDGHRKLLHADFTVNNGGGAPVGDYELGVAEVSDRTGGIAELIPPPPGFPLEALHGMLFIYLGDSSSCTLAGCPPIDTNTVVESVDYYLDDPGMTGAPLNNDPDAPFDFNGGTVSDGNGFDFDALALGEHSITVEVHEVGGGSAVFTRSFLVVPVDAILPEALDPSMLEEDPQLADGAGLIKDRAAAIALGKAFFWDVQAGSNGDVACATCHYHAGADNRILNTVAPGFNGNFDAVAAAGEILDTDDFPFHRFADQLTGDGGLEQSFDDIAGSQGVLKKDFVSVNPGNPIDTAGGPAVPENVFLDLNGDPTLQVTGRNTPTNINAIFNIRCFWDGRANFDFNGVNPFGPRDPDARIYRNNGAPGSTPDPEILRVRFSCAASQAVGPPLSNVEMSWDRRTFPELGRKLISLPPLQFQEVHPSDSVFGPAGLVPVSGPGLDTSYMAMIMEAFDDSLWDGGTVDLPLGNGGTETFSQMEANFPLFWGLAIQAWEATLISDESKFDDFRRAGQIALDAALESADTGVDNVGVAILTAQEARGMNLFIGNGACIACHAGPVLSAATVPFLRQAPIPPEGPEQIVERMLMAQGEEALELGLPNPPNRLYDVGFYNIGVRPTFEDIGNGGTDPFGNPLSYAAQLSSGILVDDFTGLQSVDPCLFGAPFTCEDLAGLPIAVNGAFKTPTLRNIELTAPYMHNGGMATLDEVVKFYARGADFFEENIQDLDPEVGGIGTIRGNQDRVDDLVAFMLTFTDPRVANEEGPFDHPSIVLPNGVFVEATGDTGLPGGPLPTFVDRLEGPTAKADNYVTAIDTNVVDNVSTNDSDGTGGGLSDFLLVDTDGDGTPDGPANGVLTGGLDNATGAFTYDPDPAFRGVDTFSYDMESGGFRSNVAIVSIQVGGAAPVAEPDSYDVVDGNNLVVGAPGVLDNDTDADTPANQLTATLISGPSIGALQGGVLNPDGSFTYVPAGVGTDSFMYRVNDPEGPGSTTTVTINVTPANAGTPCPATATLNICFSTSADRSNPLLLDGASVAGNIYVFVNPLFPTQAIRRVDFFLNETSNSSALRYSRENAAPYDFNGTSGGGDAVPFDSTAMLSGGGNFIRAKIPMTDGSPRVILRADFTRN